MPFDPTLPAPNSQILSSVLRDQFNSLDSKITGVEAFAYGCAQDPVSVEPLSLPISNPPTQAQVQTIRDKVNELLAALHE